MKLGLLKFWKSFFYTKKFADFDYIIETGKQNFYNYFNLTFESNIRLQLKDKFVANEEYCNW